MNVIIGIVVLAIGLVLVGFGIYYWIMSYRNLKPSQSFVMLIPIWFLMSTPFTESGNFYRRRFMLVTILLAAVIITFGAIKGYS